LLAHGCYKAFFFLSTGNALQSVEPGHHGNEKEHHKPQGMWSLYGGALILSCIPPFILFSGPYELLWGVTGFTSAKIGFWVVGLITIFVTANYLFRSITSLFVHGPKTYWPASGKQDIQPQFLNGSILVGVVFATVLVGGLLMVLWKWFANFLAPAVAIRGMSLGEVTGEPSFSAWILIPIGVAIAGWAFAYSVHVRPRQQVSNPHSRTTRLYVLFWNKFYVDEIYDAYVVHPTLRLAQWLSHRVEEMGIKQMIKNLGHQAANVGEMLTTVEPRLVGQNILVLIFGFVFTMGILYWLV
ncbi:MAG: hypothetical protein O7F12_14200, partial [Nitrospirae bacterium]|nr:hypothetical protein [Nitrospirota bacterium]